MRHLRTAVVLLASLAFVSCSSAPNTPRNATELPRFEVRGLKNVGSKTSYSTATSFSHTATIVALGDSVATRGTYLVLVSVKRVEGGDPEEPRDPNDNAMVLVRGGVGEFAAYGGFRTSDERWDPEKIEVQIIGALPIIEISDTTKYRN